MPEEMEVQQEQKKKGLPEIVKIVLIPLVVSVVATMVVLFALGTNRQPQNQQQEQAVTAPVQIKAVVIAAGKYQTFMLKGGRDVAVVDSLTLLVGSEPCRAAVAEKNDEIMDALATLFLSKEKFDLVTPAGLDLLKKQIREAVNEITGFTGEREKFGVLNVYIYIKAISSVQ
ncbi:flagellar basal body-associated FliL family protein [Fervidobacterium thailandense]|uniref:Flagellar protein FliL n=1 Tax=Fervidobacterium thailandense TaxID=1008305 RepID=A0A1E3G6K5_9BACT|nr:flagellar basal body-associated FliL family protein [Fervidobacterium thailandense]ODN31248.1 flagellar basal body protein FliL [Fervidobacterium thailandense]